MHMVTRFFVHVLQAVNSETKIIGVLLWRPHCVTSVIIMGCVAALVTRQRLVLKVNTPIRGAEHRLHAKIIYTTLYYVFFNDV